MRRHLSVGLLLSFEMRSKRLHHLLLSPLSRIYRVLSTGFDKKRRIYDTLPISETIEDIYGFETSESFISDVTDKILPQIEDWQNRPLDEVYPSTLMRSTILCEIMESFVNLQLT